METLWSERMETLRSVTKTELTVLWCFKGELMVMEKKEKGMTSSMRMQATKQGNWNFQNYQNSPLDLFLKPSEQLRGRQRHKLNYNTITTFQSITATCWLMLAIILDVVNSVNMPLKAKARTIYSRVGSISGCSNLHSGTTLGASSGILL